MIKIKITLHNDDFETFRASVRTVYGCTIVSAKYCLKQNFWTIKFKVKDAHTAFRLGGHFQNSINLKKHCS
ncbi:hypothetical protein [Aquimarina algicola]|uniref:hypothetical protein n=1 Tax=Aquimarina algicola TaxID=2589995 RepID=UPI00112D7718|nr:hypothetical protein [Aquimarina algicola]